LDADVGVIPLRISSGTDVMLPTKLLEYVSLGIPCIVPRTGTISRYFDETMVRFFEASSVESLAEAIVDLYLHPSTRAALARNATRRFGSIYNWSEHKKVYVTLVSELIAG
jgi:glycosyltransferase involved in cell wall biosynthesis